jgi:glutathione-independent formaldehyde dehydrogenase
LNGRLGIPGLHVTDDPGGVDEPAKTGNLSIRIGLGWAKSHVITTGQCPVMRYHRPFMHAILYDKFHPAKAVNVTRQRAIKISTRVHRRICHRSA